MTLGPNDRKVLEMRWRPFGVESILIRVSRSLDEWICKSSCSWLGAALAWEACLLGWVYSGMDRAGGLLRVTRRTRSRMLPRSMVIWGPEVSTLLIRARRRIVWRQFHMDLRRSHQGHENGRVPGIAMRAN